MTQKILLLTLLMVWVSEQKLINQFFSKMYQEGCGGIVLTKKWQISPILGIEYLARPDIRLFSISGIWPAGYPDRCAFSSTLTYYIMFYVLFFKTNRYYIVSCMFKLTSWSASGTRATSQWFTTGLYFLKGRVV